MKRLLLLFILSPVISFGQVRQKAIVDSIRAAANDLQRVSALIKNTPGGTVEQIDAADSAGYVSIVVRLHIAEPIVIPVLSTLSLVTIKTADAVAARANTVTLLPPFRPRLEPDTVVALSLMAMFKFDTKHFPVATMGAVSVPPLPRPVLEPDTVVALSLRAMSRFSAKQITVSKMDMVTVPPFTDVKMDIDALSFITVVPYRIEAVVVARANVVAEPVLPELEPETIEPLEPTVAAIMPVVLPRRPDKMYKIPVPAFVASRLPVAEMHLSDEGYELLEKLEGFSPELYSLKDGGLTIGFGFFVPYAEAGKWDKGVTIEAAELIMRQKMPAYEDQVKKYINVPLTQLEFDALTMLAYNLGSFSKATSIVNDINTNADFEQLQKDWMRFVHSKAPGVMKGLMNRRRDEMQVRSESNYQDERKIQIIRNQR